VGDKPVATAVMVIRKGVAYEFVREAPEEVIIIDSARARVVLFNVKRKVQTEISTRRLDEAMRKLHDGVRLKAENDEKTGTRSERVMAEKRREMIDASLPETFDPSTRRLKLANATIAVEATGEPEPDRARLLLTANALAAIVKLGAVHDLRT